MHFLHVEDDPLDAELIARAISEAHEGTTWTRVETDAEYESALNMRPDVVIADYALPRFSGLRALEILKRAWPEIPFILVSGAIGDERAAEIMRLGAHDVVLKEHLRRLPSVVARVVHDARERSAMQRAKAEIEAGLRHAQVMARLAHVITSPDGAFETWSETLPPLIGMTSADMPNSTRAWLGLLHPDDRARFRSMSLAAAANGRRTDIEYRLRRADGIWVDVRQAVEPIPGSYRTDGRMRWFCTLQDVTEQKKTANKFNRLNRVHSVMSAINQLIVRVRTREGLFSEVSRIAVEAGGFSMAWFRMLDPATGNQKTVAWYGREQHSVDVICLTAHRSTGYGDSAANRSFRQRVPVVVNDIDAQCAAGPYRDAILMGGHRSAACLPLLVDDEAVGVITLLADEVDYFDDDEVALLLELARDIGLALDRLAKKERLDHLAYFDALTGLANNTLLQERLARHVASSAATGEHLALALIDVERFQRINDTLGRHAGDVLLQQVAARLASSLPDVQHLARVGADHFAMILSHVHAETSVARILSERMHHCFGRPFDVQGHGLRLSAKVGVALFPADGPDAETLYRNAEIAVRKGKASTERLLFYDPCMTEAVAEKLALENDLRRALEDDEFVLHYQPKIDLKTSGIVGLEALIRWNSPELGLVQPMTFVPLLEETGLILDVGLWALRQAALDRKRWIDEGIVAPRVAVNVSAVQLCKADFVATVEAALRMGPDPHGIDLEITESLVMQDIEGTLGKLQALRALDIDLAIDDFGTGYSSLAYLAKLPAQTLKIDRTFIMTMVNDASSMTVVSTMISLAHSLRMKVIAEGVETKEQAEMLLLLHCDQIQGYLVSKPLAFEQMSALMRRQV